MLLVLLVTEYAIINLDLVFFVLLSDMRCVGSLHKCGGWHTHGIIARLNPGNSHGAPKEVLAFYGVGAARGCGHCDLT